MTVEVHIDTSKLKQVKQEMFNAIASKQTAKLLEYAPLQLANAYNNRSFKNRTANLADSYVWAVYFMGKIQGSGYLWNNRAATTESIYHHTKINGRKLADEFIKRYKAENFNGWEIVWAATAPYSVILESGSNNMNRFFVLSNMYDEIASDFKGKAIIELKKNI